MMSHNGKIKLIEECGELITVLAKSIQYPIEKHPDGKGDLNVRIEEEIADVRAAICFLVSKNLKLDLDKINDRALFKENLYRKWDKEHLTDYEATTMVHNQKIKLTDEFGNRYSAVETIKNCFSVNVAGQSKWFDAQNWIKAKVDYKQDSDLPDFMHNVPRWTQTDEKILQDINSEKYKPFDSVKSTNNETHYQGDLCMQAMESISIDKAKAFCQMCIFKYIWRLEQKTEEDPIKTIEKIEWYANRLKGYFKNDG